MRKFIFVFLFLIISLSYLFEVDELLAKKFTFVNDLKHSYINNIYYKANRMITKHTFHKIFISLNKSQVLVIN